MGEYTDRFFIHPRLLLTAKQVGVYDAINLVIYAKFPLINARRGKELVAGFVPCDELSAQGIWTKSQTDRLVDKFGTEAGSLRYPIGPSQYEPLLERLLEDGEDALPYFYHEHHLLVDRRRRAAAFTRVNRELLEEVRKGEVILQRSDSERTHLMASDAWMTNKTLSAYLDRQGVAPWWEIDTNLASHARLERVLLSDTLDLPNSEIQEIYDVQQIPSFVFAEMLLKRSKRSRGYERSVQKSSEASRIDSTAEKPKYASSQKLPKNLNALAPFDVFNDSSVGDSSSPRESTKQLRPQSQGAESSSTEIEARVDRSSNDEPSRAESTPWSEFPTTTSQAMLSKREVGALLGVHVNTVDNYRDRHDFPEPVKYGGTTLRWEQSDILRWKNSQKNPAR